MDFVAETPEGSKYREMASKIEDTLRFMKVMFTHFVSPRRVRDPLHPPRAVGCKRPGARPAVTGKCRSCALSVQTEDRRSEPSTKINKECHVNMTGGFLRRWGREGGERGERAGAHLALKAVCLCCTHALLCLTRSPSSL